MEDLLMLIGVLVAALNLMLIIKIWGACNDIKRIANKFAPKEGLRKQVREELQISDDTFYILSVGELNKNKNHRVLLEALSKIPDKSIHLGICGRGYLEEDLKLVRTKQFYFKPMTREEAILQMNLLEHSFFAFRDADHGGAFAVVYRRNDGGYGLIEDVD